MDRNPPPPQATASGPWLFILSIAALVWYLVILSLGLLGCLTARRRYRVRPRSPLASSSPSAVPGVSILRPLKGLDTNLYENLESTFTQDYPNFEILLSVADPDDQALPVVRAIIDRYPNVVAKLIIGEDIIGVNPKVNNLVRSYEEAANDILWVLDSNVSVAPGTLGRAVDILEPPPSRPTPSRRIALVHHVPIAAINQQSLGSKIEAAFLNTNHAKMYLAINALAVDSCVVGKSNLYRRSDVNLVNGDLRPRSSTVPQVETRERGLRAFGRFLAEDNMIASALWHELGLRHDVSCDVALNAVGNMSFSAYVWRRVRWIRVRKHMVLAATLIEPFTESVVLGCIASVSLRQLFAIPGWLFFLGHFIAWFAIDVDVYSSLADHPVPLGSLLSFAGSWVARELLALPIWILAIIGSEVEWRGKRYIVMQSGEVRKAGDSTKAAWWTRPTQHYYTPLGNRDNDLESRVS